MSVIINEFEIEVEPPAEAESTESAGLESGAAQPMLSPMDFRDVDRWLEQRQARLRAH